MIALLEIGIFLLPFLFNFSDTLNSNDKNPCFNVKEGSFVKDPKYCEKFFQCRNGQPISVTCPEGMYFDPEDEYCDIKENVLCKPEIEDEDGSIEKIVCPEKDEKNIVFKRSHINCARYYICYHGEAIPLVCAPGLHFNERIDQCDLQEKANCKIGELPRCPTTGEKLFPHPDDCSYFVYCINKLSILQQCPFYHYWDLKTWNCQWKNRAICILDLPENERKKYLI